jgi:hypothetical protein
MQFHVKTKMAEVLLEIAQNVSIRGIQVDGVYLFSVLEFIKYICPGYNSIYAPTLWYRLISARPGRS